MSLLFQKRPPEANKSPQAMRDGRCFFPTALGCTSFGATCLSPKVIASANGTDHRIRGRFPTAWLGDCAGRWPSIGHKRGLPMALP